LSAGRVLGLILVPGLLVAAAAGVLTFRSASGDSLPDAGPWVFVAVDRAAAPDAVAVIQLANTSVFTTLPLDCGGDCKPFGLALSPAGDRLYVSNSQADSVSVIDLATLQVTATWPLKSPADSQVRTPRELAVSPDGSRLYVSNQAAGTVSIFDTGNGRVITETAVGLSPRGIDFLPDGRAVVVTQGDAATPGTISVLSPITYGVVMSRTVQTGEQPVAVRAVGNPVNQILVLEQAGGSGQNQVEKFDFNLAPLGSPFQVGNGPVAMVYDGQTLTLYVACGTDKDIWKINLSGQQVERLGATFNPNPPTPFNGLALYPGSDSQSARLIVVGGGGSAGGNIALAGFVDPQSPRNSSTIQADPDQNSTPWGVVVYTKPAATPTPTSSPTPVSPVSGCADPARRCLFLPVLAR